MDVLNIVNTNNGVEALNKHFDKSVFGIAVLLVELFIPDAYQHYIDTNLKQSSLYRKFNDATPSYLHNRPAHFIRHCMRSRFNAGEFQESDVHCLNIGKGEFRVRSSAGMKVEHTIQLLTPSCTCEEWHKTHFPCKHFYAIFNAYDEWDFSRLPHSYLTNVFITLDYIGFTAPEESDPKETLHSKRKIDTEDDDDDNVLREEVSQDGDDDWPEEESCGDHDSTSNENAARENPVRTSLKDSVRQ